MSLNWPLASTAIWLAPSTDNYLPLREEAPGQQILVDRTMDADHCPARLFTRPGAQFPASYRLTATPWSAPHCAYCTPTPTHL
ncbi:hypothetical protein AB0C70_26915 [Streptomyces sp. NPDC048564]|uniref:hypothetical protein n=1 Tax=Streptomyces sp. NPDC048564 TaxID=3155760 RepID=UPI00343A7B20